MITPAAALAEILPFELADAEAAVVGALVGAFTPADFVQIVCWSHFAANAYCGSFTISVKKARQPATRTSGVCKKETTSVSHVMTFSQPLAAVAATSVVDFELD